ncbi:hypothetical protein D3C81_750800 [compost metagenome]
MIHHAQGRQRLVAFDAAVLLRHRLAGGVEHRAVVPVSADVFKTDARCHGPVADIDFVVDIHRVRFSATGTVLIDVSVGTRTYNRFVAAVERQAAGRFVHAFLQVAITDADFLGGRADVEHMGHPWLDAEGVVGTRERADSLLVAGGDVAATEAVGIVGQHFGLGTVVDLPCPLERHILAAAAEVVVVAVGLERVGVVLLLRQATGHVGAGVVVVEVEAEIVVVGRCPVGLEDHVVDVVAVVALAVTVAVYAGVQQRHTDAVVRGAADKRGVDVLPAAVLGGFQGAADFSGRFFRDRTGHEVDYAAHVLWSVADRTGAAHHVDAVEVAGGNRRHRQLRLAVRGEGRRHAVDQHGRAWRQTRSQTTHADVEGDVAAAGAVGFLHLHAGYALEHVAHVHRALLDHGFTADHGTRAGVVLHHGGVGIAEPVADHLDVGRAQFQRAVRRRSRRRHQGHRTFIDLVLQAAALQQLTQRFFRRNIAVHRRGLLAGNQFRAEKNLQRSLLAQLSQGLAQGLRLDVDGVCGECLRHRHVDRQRESQRQPREGFVFSGGFIHVERIPVDRKSVRLLMQTSCS